ncbi:MAG: methyltransferase domain-containing protein [Candidatus Omnitrophica bacterium]|nr:methyltransferase domain-containing protein [Candidatus Omnitrophota bacterium]
MAVKPLAQGPVEDNFELECTTVWSFPNRGRWAGKTGSYRGNWAPQIPRNVILRYSQEGDTVLDPMVGSGTTLVECAITGRKGIGYDVNPKVIALAKENLKLAGVNGTHQIALDQGDARHLPDLAPESVDLILTHPPYADIVRYSEDIGGDLSLIHGVEEFCAEIRKVAQECLRVLKPNRFCAILMGDTRRKQHYIPLAFRVMEEFLKAGFVLKEDVIKQQHNCRATGYWTCQSKKFNFLLIMHEHLFVFRKP